jgi:predicted site-specific integrase-resolvase
MQKTKVTISTDDLMTVNHAAEALGKHIATIYRWYEAGKVLGVEFDGILYIPTSEVKRMKKADAPGRPGA